MDNGQGVNTAQQPVQVPPQAQAHSSRKWIYLVAGVVVLILLGVGVFVLATPASKKDPSTNQPTIIQASPSPVVSVEMQKALDEAKGAAKEYDAKQAELREEYPWLRKLPMVGDKFYVYFDTQKKAFVGRIYPKSGDNVEQMKTMIIQQLKTVKQIPADQYKFEWVVNGK